MPMAEDQDHAHFVWVAKKGVKVCARPIVIFESVLMHNIFQAIYYLRMTTSNPSVLPQPSANVSHSGRIPEEDPEAWRVSMPCRFGGGGGEDEGGAERSEVTVGVEIVVDNGGGEDMAFNIR